MLSEYECQLRNLQRGVANKVLDYEQASPHIAELLLTIKKLRTQCQTKY